MNKLNIPRLVGILILGVVAALLSIDLLQAATAQACPSAPDCYPWGSEGPVAGSWSYASKRNYLVRGFAQLALIIVAGGLLLWKAGEAERVTSGRRAVFCAVLGAVAVLTFI